MTNRLYVIPASHPATTAALMLDFKGIEYKRTDLMPVVSKGALRAAGFPRTTVPAVKIGGEKIQGSREIARALDRIQPDPPLFPADPDRRAAVEDAERFGDEEMQHPLRQLLWWCFHRDKELMRSYSEGAHLGVPLGLAIKTGGPLVAMAARLNEATDVNARAALAALPDLLDRVDSYVADGTIGGEEPNAADFQLATSIGVALTMDDLKPLIEPRPCVELARRYVPNYPGHTPPILPPAWLPTPAVN
ncbi:MAG TPA: glutathione S-transferase N-terminal domain-containing protein [Solirubrobacterales bacterium]|jgi:glutathione S-transferase|nr:glutathione S-transferase N-terminal domain-containing protein [Solirubrobacterales bacterium]